MKVDELITCAPRPGRRVFLVAFEDRERQSEEFARDAGAIPCEKMEDPEYPDWVVTEVDVRRMKCVGFYQVIVDYRRKGHETDPPFLVDNNPHDMGLLAEAALSFLTDVTERHGCRSIEALAAHLKWSFEETVRLRSLIVSLLQYAKYHDVKYGYPGDAAKLKGLPGESLPQMALRLSEGGPREGTGR